MYKKITLILFVLLQCSVLVAQNYIYPVTSGTSWAREIYPKIERAQFQVMREGTPLPGAPNFGRIFKQITDSFNKSSIYNDSIFFNLSQEEWISMFGRRAVSFAQYYDDNNNAIDELKNYFKRDYVPEAAYDSLYFYMRRMFHRNTNDVFLIEDFMNNILIPHYEETQDMEHLIFCYTCAGMYNFQCARMGDRETALRSEIAYHKVMNMRNQFASFKDPLNRYYFISDYVNLAIMHTQAGNASLQESLNLTQNIRKIYASPEVQEIFKADSLLNAYAEWSLDLFSLRGIATYISQGWKGERMKNQLYTSYKEFKDKIANDFNSLNNRYYAKLPYEDLLIEAYMGHITWNEAHTQVKQMVTNDPDLVAGEDHYTPIKIGYLNNLFETTIHILNQASVPYEVKAEGVKRMLNRMLSLISHYEHSRYPFEKGMILANIAQKNEVLKYLTPQERYDLIFQLIVTEQPTTYVHVTMVADLARILSEKMIEKKPEFFVGMPNMATEADVVQHKDSLLDFIYQAAIFHDLGKISMPTVVNNCIRKIFDHEYNILSLHPQKSLPFFNIDPSLKEYQDIALGHHKWYNGRGYPATFDHRESVHFPVIGIVTVCDCLDAATENIGRNYHHPKPFETVLKEFIAEIGTRYDPNIINLIRSDKELQLQMKQIVSDGRNEHYYRMYTRYMAK